MSRGRFGIVERDIDAAALGPTPEAPAGAWTIEGRVVDDQVRPLQGVEVRVATGIGSLKGGFKATTDADGRYELHFGPGMLSKGANAQYAIVHAHKSGYFEKDLCQAGNLGMANHRPEEPAGEQATDQPSALGWRQQGDNAGLELHSKQKDSFGVVGWVYPGHPYRVDFTMLPAASVTARLVDAQGVALANYRVDLTGEKLYPASSVLASEATDEQGRVEFRDVPLNHYFFEIGGRSAEYKSEPFPFDKPEQIQLRLIYDDLAGTLVVERD